MFKSDHEVAYIHIKISRQKFPPLILTQITTEISCTIVQIGLNNI